MTRLLAALALVIALSGPVKAAHARQHRTVCVTYHDPGAGPVRICGLPVRRR